MSNHEVITAPAVPPNRAFHRERRPRWQRVFGYLFVVIAVLLTAGLGVGIVEYNSLNHELRHLVIGQHQTGPTPKRKVVGAQNWLIIGSDTRSGRGNSQYGGNVIQGQRSDTVILAHLSRGATSATLVSIPRDSYVQIPACTLTDGEHGKSTPQMNKFNDAYSIGGAACTIKTVQSLTHVAIDHFVIVDFNGFKTMVNALGGVRVCLSAPIDDPVRTDPLTGGKIGSGLVASAGYHTFNGTQALGFVRSRYAIANGSDLDRIKDQQYFISAVIKKATSIGLLVDFPKLLNFLHAVVHALTVDKDTNVNSLARFAEDVHSLPPRDVNMLTVPLSNPDATADIGGAQASVVLWDQTASHQLFHAIRYDIPLPGQNVKRPKPSTSVSPSTSSTPSTQPSGPALTVPPSGITVNVLNGTATSGLAHRVAAELQTQGFQIGTIGDAPSATSTTTVEYGPDKVQSSQTLATAVDGGAPRQLVGTMSGSVTLVVGSDFSKVSPVTIGSSSPSTSTSTPSGTPSTSASLGFTNANAEHCALG